MKTFKKYILQQVAEGRLPKEKAAEMLLEASEGMKATEDEIAIIGMSARFPKAENVAEFWENIRHRINCIDTPADARKELMKEIYKKLFNADDIAANQYEAGGYLDDIDKFDAAFFGISPEEAILMNPLQRIMLETAFLAFEDAGIPRDTLAHSKTGVFIGRDNASVTLYNDYIGNVHPYALTGAYASVLASRISYELQLNGPAMVIDTACSSALVSVHHACKALRDGDCEMALVGGINLKDYIVHSDKSGMNVIVTGESSVRTFDEEAKGTVLSEGAGAFVLKPLHRALADGDQVHAVIKGSAVNNDGGTARLAIPRMETQADVMIAAWNKAKIHPDTISYMEAHGIGTYLGDSIEIRAIKQAFERFTDQKQFCAVSAVKTNIGHTVAASGMASLIKAVMALKTKKIPPLLHFSTPNSNISFPDGPLYVNDILRDWDHGSGKRRCGINSFGFGGTNCHIVLEEAPETKRADNGHAELSLLCISARTEKALEEIVDRYSLFLSVTPCSLKEICYSAVAGRDHYGYRLSIAAESIGELKAKIKQVQEAGLNCLEIDGVCYGKSSSGGNKRQGTGTGSSTNKAAEGLSLRGNPAELCRLYTEGADIDWKAVYQDRKCTKVSLPAYPLERTSYWFKEEDAKWLAGAGRWGGNSEPAPDIPAMVPFAGGPVEDSSETVQKLAAVWGSVLGRPITDLDRSFFELGGDSISGIKVVNQIRSDFEIEMDLIDLWRFPLIRELGAYVDKRTVAGQTTSVIPRVNIADGYYPLHPAQQRILIHNQIKRGTAYNLPRALFLEGEVEADRIEDILNSIVQRHEALRTSFHLVRGQYVQRVNQTAEVVLEVIESADGSFHPGDVEAFIRYFDLSKPPLFRARLVKLGHARYVLMWDMHHIISDRASIIILMKEFQDLFAGRALPELKLHYKDYAVWTHRFFGSENASRQEEYWLNLYTGPLPAVKLNTDFERVPQKRYTEETKVYTFPDELKLTMRLFCADNGITLNMLLFTVYNILLWKWTGSEDQVIGINSLGRNRSEIESVFGMFVNTLPMRNQPKGTKTFMHFLQETQRNLLDAYDNQDYPYETLLEKLRSRNGGNMEGLIQTFFIMQNIDFPPLEIAGLKVEPYPDYITVEARFDLQVNVFNTEGNRLNICFIYCKELFREESINQLMEQYAYILDQAVRNSHLTLDGLVTDMAKSTF
jgi:3-oxoacyl-(acyl-carrier-protein) synthase/acyl carrier protein